MFQSTKKARIQINLSRRSLTQKTSAPFASTENQTVSLCLVAMEVFVKSVPLKFIKKMIFVRFVERYRCVLPQTVTQILEFSKKDSKEVKKVLYVYELQEEDDQSRFEPNEDNINGSSFMPSQFESVRNIPNSQTPLRDDVLLPSDFRSENIFTEQTDPAEEI